MFAYPCPFCGQRLLASEDRRGQRTICSKCLKPIQIPKPEPAEMVGAVDFAAANGIPVSAPAPIPATVPPPAPPIAGPTVLEVSDTPPPVPPPPPPRRVHPPRMTAAVPAEDSAAGMVVLSPGDFDSTNVAADLSTALTMRMKPPPEPPGDLRVSTGLWLVLTATGVSLWAFSLAYDDRMRAYVALIGFVELVVGYAWVVYLAGKRSVAKGLIAVLPPVALRKMFLPTNTQGYRPARYAVAGAVLLGLYLAAPVVGPAVQNAIGLNDALPPKPPVTRETVYAKLKDLVETGNDFRVLDELRDLADRAKIVDPKRDPGEKAVLIGELKKLRKSESSDVRTESLRTLVAWTQEESQAEVVAALKSPSDKERSAALQIAGRWPTPAVADAIAVRLTARQDALTAKKAFQQMIRDGSPDVVVAAILKALAADDSEELRAAAQEFLELYTTLKTLPGLEKLAGSAADADAKKWYDSLVATVKRRLAVRG